ALASVRRADPAAAGLAAAVDHYDRIGMKLPLRDLELDVGLSHHRHVAFDLDIAAADVEVALRGNRQRLVCRAGCRYARGECQRAQQATQDTLTCAPWREPDLCQMINTAHGFLPLSLGPEPHAGFVCLIWRGA